ncbi:MAG: formate/nitrite transporter family protein [Eubacteriales bacterium]|nr:formate/nitrite transporter family protein [Eubacteriales bacterium]
MATFHTPIPEDLTPPEIYDYTVQSGIRKATRSSIDLLLLAILGGAFIAFASEGSNMAAFNLLARPETFGLGKALAGSIFGTGLMLVVIAGAELFTGNMLMLTSLMSKKIKLLAMLRNWLVVFVGNFLGSVLIAWMMNVSGLFHSGANDLAAVTIKIAVYKIGLNFMQAFVLGIMCNWLVSLAVWMAYGSRTIAGKILAIFFPIWLFITSGFEHSVANMYYIPAGILARQNSDFVDAALQLGVSPENIKNLTWGHFFINNLIPVTLGNVIGGGLFVALVYWFTYGRHLKPVD